MSKINSKIRKIAIVGGGTAGWLAANHMGLEAAKREGLSITVIESPEVPTIGVGEGTVPLIKISLERFGISEAELLLRCEATFKTGIKFINWMERKESKKNNFFYHSFDTPYISGLDPTNYWLSSKICDFSELDKSYLVSENNRSPKLRESPPYKGVVNYAYHFDARKFSDLLSENAIRRFGVIHKKKTITSASLDESGFISSLNYEGGESEDFDFVIDCSGFSSLLIGKLFDVPFVDKCDQILADKALALQVKSDSEDEIFPYTKATAHKAGWIWDIPLATRRGTGFVYSSAHMSEQEAMAEFAGYHGEKFIEGNVRSIPMKAGYRKKFWVKNCAALGLAQGFIEPLEATSIVITDKCAELIASLFPDCRDDIEGRAKQLNLRVEQIWERVIDFVQLHYAISDRRDSRFWCDCTDGVKVSDVLRDRLSLWESFIPNASDFTTGVDFFNRESFLFVVYGMEFPTKPIKSSKDFEMHIENKIKEHFLSSQALSNSLIGQRRWLKEFYNYAKSSGRL